MYAVYVNREFKKRGGDNSVPRAPVNIATQNKQKMIGDHR